MLPPSPLSSSTNQSNLPSSSIFSSEEYFATQSPPPRLEEEIDRVRKFVSFHVRLNRRIVLITSGGTTVPLEHNVVRYLDNFSAGTRGSASAEYFLRTNRYAVIFLHRAHSLQPFTRHYPHSTHPFLDIIHLKSDSEASASSQQQQSSSSDAPLFPPLSSVPIPSSSSSSTSTDVQISISAGHFLPLSSILSAYQAVQSEHLILPISFITVNEYLYYLRSIAQVLGETELGLGRKALLYLAAAVSDFFIPQQKLFEHKIQSGKGSLVIEMDAVPKVLKDVTQEWSNQAFIVSFKLETDSNLLIPKSKIALERYGHQLVIANELHSRKNKCYLIDRSGQIELIELKLDHQPAHHEIEEDLVNALILRHDHWIQSQPQPQSP